MRVSKQEVESKNDGARACQVIVADFMSRTRLEQCKHRVRSEEVCASH